MGFNVGVSFAWRVVGGTCILGLFVVFGMIRDDSFDFELGVGF